MHIDDIADPALMKTMIDEGYIRVQSHPTLPLEILNYTDKTTFERMWNDATRAARGLVVDPHGQVVARPFRKFMNHNEPGAHVPGAAEEVVVTDKADGSLGILYPTPRGHAIATRGSFTSEQALHATRVWQERYEGTVTPFGGLTFLFEIVYPTNRIVLDYDGMDDLILLGAVNIEQGRSLSAEQARGVLGWSGPVIETFEYASLADALGAPPRDNAEGLVVWFPLLDERVKIKQADYVALHRIMTGCTTRTLWELAAVHDSAMGVAIEDEPELVKYLERKLHLGKDRIREILALGPDWMDAYLQGVPEEFEEWVRTTVDALGASAGATYGAWANAFSALLRERGRPADGKERGEFVRHVREQMPGAWHVMMSQLDGKEIVTTAWWAVYPPAERPFFSRGEDVA